jgi:hypothetical protein
MVEAVSIDVSRCPLCGELNQCAMEVERATGEKQPPCWCTRVDFRQDLISSLPSAARGRACICAACADKAGG